MRSSGAVLMPASALSRRICPALSPDREAPLPRPAAPLRVARDSLVARQKRCQEGHVQRSPTQPCKYKRREESDRDQTGPEGGRKEVKSGDQARPPNFFVSRDLQFGDR